VTCGKNSTNIQNQIIDSFDEIILTKVNNTKSFTVLVDETFDIFSTEQFSLCVRYIESIDINNFKIVEQFLKFVSVAGVDPEGGEWGDHPLPHSP
jgi:hypothetical protein